MPAQALTIIADNLLEAEFGTTHEIRRNAVGGVQRHPMDMVGRLFRINDPNTVRIGCCWMRGRLRRGDLVLCLGHNGDCFQDYILVEERDNCLRGIKGSEFGSYGVGDAVLAETQLSNTSTLAQGRTRYLQWGNSSPW